MGVSTGRGRYQRGTQGESADFMDIDPRATVSGFRRLRAASAYGPTWVGAGRFFWNRTITVVSHEPHVAFHHVKCGWCDRETQALNCVSF